MVQTNIGQAVCIRDRPQKQIHFQSERGTVTIFTREAHMPGKRFTVEKINKKLEELTSFVLGKEKKNIDLLATLDEIRGLLVDLYK